MSDIPSAANAGLRVWMLRLTLESIKTGELTIPPLEAHYATDAKSTTLSTVRSSPIPIRITSVLEDRANPKTFRDIKQTVDVTVPSASITFVGRVDRCVWKRGDRSPRLGRGRCKAPASRTVARRLGAGNVGRS